jgi:hypothetical protein
MKSSWILLCMTIASKLACAIDCGPAKVMAIQSQATTVLVYVVRDGYWSVWKKLGDQGTDALKSFQAIAQQSFAMDSLVYLRFPDGYDCATTDYVTQPSMIRLFK